METFPGAAPGAAELMVPGFDPVRLLGGGSQGDVWLLTPHDGAEPVAGKVFNAAAPDPGVAAPAGNVRHNESHVTREWRALTQFRHEHLVPIHRLVRAEDGRAVVLMEFAAGGSLLELVGGRGPLTVGETVTVLTPLGQVLAFLHARGTVHGDISPGNIVFTAAGKPMLADLGCATILGQAPGTLTGTPGFYCPTDVARDAPADVYALACIGWFALTGTPAPPTAHRMPLGHFVKEVPGELLAALEAGLQEDPRRRPTAAAFAQAVFRSAKAEALALGASVHPSVLPDLPTRRDVKVRRRRIRNGIRREPRRPVRLVRRAANSVRRALGSPLRGRRQRQLQGMWDSQGGQRSRGRRRPKAWGMVLLPVAAAVLGTMGLRALLIPGGGADDAVEAAQPGVPVVAGSDSQAWAAALPPDVQRGLAAQDPLAALPALAWTRSYALATADAELLDQVNAALSPAAVADQAIMTALQDRGHTLTGLETTVAETSRTDVGSAHAFAVDTATVAALVTTSAFAEQDAGGAVVHRQVAAAAQRLDIVLVKADGRWVVSEVRAPP